MAGVVNDPRRDASWFFFFFFFVINLAKKAVVPTSTECTYTMRPAVHIFSRIDRVEWRPKRNN